MFGLESQKKKKPIEEFVFELEKELKDPVKHKEIRQRIDNRLPKLKEMLTGGSDKEEFDRIGLLLHGYNSLLKVMARFTTKKIGN
jgi:hypothetical protein